ncbi:amidohydrolase [Mesorhizobium retamae]|uniref:Amidohydrolase n=1 Tax=Mesorhizobium retamae TaxID=2912854 RepID=A0ABS9QKV4_9HYPH|nr:amidohydrolase [Mesorhizobium sp. IRAMC:0171]MCG7507366.1 amidohydrolase [Mesorhizobium sp. IRAMC:0171]
MKNEYPGKLLLTSCLVAFVSTVCSANAAADLIIVNGDVRTVDLKKPKVQAFAIDDGKFAAIGSNDEIRALADSETKIIDAGGKTVTPGFIDGHTHLTSGTDMVVGVDLSYIPDKKTWLEKIKEADARLPKGAWLTGGGWDYTLGEGKLPTKEDLDAVVPDRVVILRDIDFHSVWVNSKALEVGAVTAKSKVKEGGQVLLNDKGEPSGILLEGAGDLVEKHRPVATDSERREGLLETLKFANSVGITAVNDMSDLGAVHDYAALVADKKMSLRVWYGFFEGDPKKIAAAVADRDTVDKISADSGEQEKKGPLLKLGYTKSVMDGVLSTRTAYLHEDYSDQKGWKGKPFETKEQLAAAIRASNENGFPTAVHAIGDGSVGLVLDAFAEASVARAQPNRIEHIEVVETSDIKRFKDLGVVASMQPNHATGTIGKYITERIGENREPRAYVWHSMLQAGVPLVFGSDWPTSPLSPLTQINDAVFRESPFGLGNGSWHPEQAVSFDQALFSYTQAGANMTPWGDQIGSISVGKWADFVIVDGTLPDPLDRSIRQRKVEATYLAGKEVYRKP